MSDPERWQAYYDFALAEKAAAPYAPGGGYIVGRFITALVKGVVTFWGRHKATLIPHLTATAIAALEALASELPNIMTVNPPGPS